MSRILSALILALAIALGPVSAVAQDNVYRVEASGLACPFCVRGLERRLTSIEGVETFEFDLESGVGRITVRDGARLTEAQVREAVRDAGFTLMAFAPAGSSKSHR